MPQSSVFKAERGGARNLWCWLAVYLAIIPIQWHLHDAAMILETQLMGLDFDINVVDWSLANIKLPDGGLEAAACSAHKAYNWGAHPHACPHACPYACHPKTHAHCPDVHVDMRPDDRSKLQQLWPAHTSRLGCALVWLNTSQVRCCRFSWSLHYPIYRFRLKWQARSTCSRKQSPNYTESWSLIGLQVFRLSMLI